MTNPEDDRAIERLGDTGDAFERRLVRSARLDRAGAAARERTLSAALGVLGRPAPAGGRRRRIVGLCAAAAVLAGGVALLVGDRQSDPRPAVLAPEPRSRLTAPSAGAVATASAPRAAPEPPVLPPRKPCPRLVVADGRDPLIDDMEDENARAAIREGRSGTWAVTGDPKARHTPRAGQTAFPLEIPGGRAQSRHGLRLFGGRQAPPGPALALNFAPGRCYDASAYAGIAFWARGRSRIHVRATIYDVMAAEFGGACRKNCYDSHQAAVDLSSEWRRYEVRWTALEQAGWGTPEPFDPRRLLGIDFSVLPPDSPFDFWIDDVEFIRR